MNRHLALVLGLASIVCPSASADAAAILRVFGEATAEKTLSVYGYVGNGQIDDHDFLVNETLIGTVLISPMPDFVVAPSAIVAPVPVTLDFDITDFLASLAPGTQWVGFSLRESESDGSVVTLEYLVLGTFLSQALVVGVTGLANVDNSVPGNPMVGTVTTGLPQDIRNPSGPTETRGVVEFQAVPVPEPSTVAIWLLTGACAVAANRRFRRM